MGGYFSKKTSVKDELVKVTEDILKLRSDIERNNNFQANFIRSTFFLLFLLSTAGSAYLFMLVGDKFKWGIYSTLTFIFSIIVFILFRKLLRPIFEWRNNRYQKHLTELIETKQKILEEIKNKESYKVASELLQEFGDEPETTYFGTPNANLNGTINPMENQVIRSSGFIQRNRESQNILRNPQSRFNSPKIDSKALQIKAAQNMSLLKQKESQAIQKSVSNHSKLSKNVNNTPKTLPPRPYIDTHNTSIVERIADMVLGDGISNRYALICIFCKSHNGMALKDEFENLAYKCYRCQKFNPARNDKEKYDECVKRSKSEANIYFEESIVKEKWLLGCHCFIFFFYSILLQKLAFISTNINIRNIITTNKK
ncbi:Protein lunapark [Strongyloides ratti]|uniref:Endoplasmic reticulum junction formation protein lunapark n=1 Tax=Strongyloides ratti TaxID=34506 RepID=A0A090MZL3_STRRB|nr:Protein lunapark [Strongyloides ratti]CEF69134.1 Protein lunapark [Strongyloides ratti]